MNSIKIIDCESESLLSCILNIISLLILLILFWATYYHWNTFSYKVRRRITHFLTLCFFYRVNLTLFFLFKLSCRTLWTIRFNHDWAFDRGNLASKCGSLVLESYLKFVIYFEALILNSRGEISADLYVLSSNCCLFLFKLLFSSLNVRRQLEERELNCKLSWLSMPYLLSVFDCAECFFDDLWFLEIS